MMSVRIDPPAMRPVKPPGPGNRPAPASYDFDDALREGKEVAVPDKDGSAQDDLPQNLPDSTLMPSTPALPVALDALLAQVSPPATPVSQRSSRGVSQQAESARAPNVAGTADGRLEMDGPLPAIGQPKAQPLRAERDVLAPDMPDQPRAGTSLAREGAVAHGSHGHQGEETCSSTVPMRPVAVKSVAAGQHFPVVGDPVRQIASEVKQVIDVSGPSPTPDPAISHVKTLNVQLEPESLGLVTLRMRLSGNQLSVRVDVAEPATLDMIQRERDRLQRSLTSGSVSIDQLEIRSVREPAPVTSGDMANANRQDASPQGQRSWQDDGLADHRTPHRREERGNPQTGQQNRHGQEHDLARSSDAGGVYL